VGEPTALNIERESQGGDLKDLFMKARVELHNRRQR
jgi:hypothetical protein